MKVVRNNVIPFKGFVAINLFGVVFIRNDREFASEEEYQTTLRHEAIHTKQMQELLYLPFYLLYFLEWLVRWAVYKDATRAYLNISFEREAYANQDKLDYNKGRKRYAFLRYIKNL